jgi:IS5 family transposase
VSSPPVRSTEHDEDMRDDSVALRLPQRMRGEAINQRLLAERAAETLACERAAVLNAGRIAHLARATNRI